MDPLFQGDDDFLQWRHKWLIGILLSSTSKVTKAKQNPDQQRLAKRAGWGRAYWK